MKTLRFVERLGSDHPVTQHPIQKERLLQKHSSENFKPTKSVLSETSPLCSIMNKYIDIIISQNTTQFMYICTIFHNDMFRPIFRPKDGPKHVVVKYCTDVHKLCCVLTDNYISILIQQHHLCTSVQYFTTTCFGPFLGLKMGRNMSLWNIVQMYINCVLTDNYISILIQ